MTMNMIYMSLTDMVLILEKSINKMHSNNVYGGRGAMFCERFGRLGGRSSLP